MKALARGQSFSQTQFRRMSELCHALAHPLRLQIVKILLEHGSQECVHDFEEILGRKQANISQHLAILRNAKVIDYHQKGVKRCYYIKAPQAIKKIMENFAKIAKEEA